MVEKPLAATVKEAQALIDIADRAGKVLMVDHTYLFSNAVRKIRSSSTRASWATCTTWTASASTSGCSSTTST